VSRGHVEKTFTKVSPASESAEIERRYAELSEAYDALKKSTEQYRLIFGNLPLGYMSMDENARIIDANQTFLEFLGYGRDEIVGKFFADLLAEGVKYHREISFPAFKRTRIARNIVWKVVKKDGSIATVTMNGRVSYDENGNFIQAHCMMMDITEQCKAEEALRKSEKEKALILGVMSERVVYHDTDRRIIWANKGTEEASDMSPEDLSGRVCFEVWRNRSIPCEDCPAMRVFETHKPQRGEVHVDGKVLEMAAHPVMDEKNRFAGVVQISADITKRKLLEKRILELSSKKRNDIGHDLHDGFGQYLTGISMLATALQQQLPPEMVDAKTTVSQIVDSADSAKRLMRSIIQGLCLVADEPEGLMSALSVLAGNITTLHNVHCSLVSEGSGLIDDHAVSTQLFSVAQEAVNNAVKHSSCSHIRIFLSTGKRAVRLSIEDDGRGFFLHSAEDQGMGLRIMRYRASMAAAALEVKSTASGTSVVCTAPLFRSTRGGAGPGASDSDIGGYVTLNTALYTALYYD
jgi:PAS domain S-box-containing protein